MDDEQQMLRIEAQRLHPKTLAPYLKHDDPQTRARAARALGRLRTAGSLSPLGRLIYDTAPAVREEAAFALGQTFGSERDLLLAWEEETEPTVKARICEALGKQGTDQAVSVLLTSLQQQTTFLRPPLEAEAAAIALGRLSTRDVAAARQALVVDALIRQLSRHDVRTRRAAAFALARGRHQQLTKHQKEAISKRIAREGDPDTRAFLVKSIGSVMGEEEWIDELLSEAIVDPDAGVRIAALRAGTKAGWSGVEIGLEDLHIGVKREAVRSVATVSGLNHRALLLPYITAGANMEAEEAFRATGDPRLILAEDAIVALDSQERLSLLMEPNELLQKDRPDRIRAAAARGQRDSATLAAIALNDPSGSTRVAAADGMVTHYGSEALPLLEARDPVVATIVAEWLIENPDPSKESKLVQLLAEPNRNKLSGAADMMAVAAQALTVLYDGAPPIIRKPDPRLNEALKTHLSHPNRQVRQSIGVLAAVVGLETSAVVVKDASYDLASIRDIQGARLLTSRGEVIMDLLPEHAPITVDNFAKLAESGYFDGLSLHRAIPDFVVQGGDPRGDGTGGPGWAIPDEINLLAYEEGAVGMALSGPDTGGSQWFVTLGPQPHLNGEYTIFGRIIEGLPSLHEIIPGDKIYSITIERRGQNTHSD